MTSNPVKLFPCDCCGEGLVVTVEKDLDLEDIQRGPFINIAFWENARKFEVSTLNWRERIKLAWSILRGKSLWMEMVTLNANVARKFANHILYLLGKEKPAKNQQEPLVVK
jgi:hypothetical protein